jgi:DNA-binding transcriptional ArsR family regulator
LLRESVRLTAKSLQKNPARALAALFSSAARVALLKVFMLDPLGAYYQRQLEAATGLAIRAIQRELTRLSEVGLLFRREEGNRTYYQVDMQFPLYPELRSMMLKAVDPVELLRGLLAMDDAVRLAFLLQDRVLLVAHGQARPSVVPPAGMTIETMAGDAFLQALQDEPATVAPFLTQGTDLLGRRDDVIWRRIEAMGFTVQKERGIP